MNEKSIPDFLIGQLIFIRRRAKPGKEREVIDYWVAKVRDIEAMAACGEVIQEAEAGRAD